MDNYLKEILAFVYYGLIVNDRPKMAENLPFVASPHKYIIAVTRFGNNVECLLFLFLLQSEADRTLIYITLYISECLKKLQKVSTLEPSYIYIYTL